MIGISVLRGFKSEHISYGWRKKRNLDSVDDHGDTDALTGLLSIYIHIYHLETVLNEYIDETAKASCHTHGYNPLITLNSGKPQLARTGSLFSTLALLASILYTLRLPSTSILYPKAQVIEHHVGLPQTHQHGHATTCSARS